MTGRRRATLFALLALIGAVALLAAGCGGGDSESAADETTVETTTETTTETDTGTEETTSEETTSSDADTGLSVFANEDCVALGAAMAQAQAALGGGSGADSSDDLQKLADKAPDEIKDAVSVLAQKSAEIAAKLKDIDMAAVAQGDASEIAKLEALGASGDAEFREAAEKVDAWVKENCSTSG